MSLLLTYPAPPGIVIDGELAHTGAVGVRDVASKSPVDADTVFRIASMTKSFTAMAILSRDAGKLSLDDPVERITHCSACGFGSGSGRQLFALTSSRTFLHDTY